MIGEFHRSAFTCAQPALFWDGRPLRTDTRLLAASWSNLSETTIEELAQTRSRFSFLRILARLKSKAAVQRQEVFVRDSKRRPALHFAFFNESVQISYGEAGFVPLERLLSYTEHELRTYVSETNRIPAIGWIKPTHLGSDMIH